MKFEFIGIGILYASIIAAAHTLQDGAATRYLAFVWPAFSLPKSTYFGSERIFFDRDPEVTTDTWAARNLRAADLRARVALNVQQFT